MKVFISFASPDRLVAEEIQLALLGAGYDVFYDEASLPAGSDYNSRIREAIEQSDIFVFLISPNSVGRGRYVHTELKYAKAKWPKPWGAVLPVMISPTEYNLIDRYLAAVTILEPHGNVAAEVAAALAPMHGQPRSGISKSRATYFVYVSRTKVEMLYPQISTSNQHEVTTERKLGAVCEYLRRNENVGTIDSPGKYIEGTVPLKYGIVSEYASEIAFFGGIVGGTKLGLIGSSASLVGAVERADSNHAPYYYTLKFLNRAVVAEGIEGAPPYYSFSEAVDIALKSLPPQTHSMEFFAKVLYTETNLVVGTPLYVAIDE